MSYLSSALLFDILISGPMVIELEGDRRIGTEGFGFYIKKGEGLAHHLPELQAWATTANNLNLPIKNKKGKITS
ncbi:MAG TPA: hypothetical protein PKC87_06485, partial [Candidatus Absconditabacterales bacterium]|nr:hypothetical protein [Candidatus Absconditabacterales bacterium]